MAEKVVDKASSFYIDLFELEWKKLVLPVLMVLVLSASAYSTLDLKSSDKNKERFDLGLEYAINNSEAYQRTEYFDNSSERLLETRNEEIGQKLEKKEDEIKTESYERKVFLAKIQKLGVFPFTPEHSVPVEVSEENFYGYMGLSHYILNQTRDLGKRLNSSENITEEEFDQEYERIRNVEIDSPEVKAFLRNSSDIESNGLGSYRLTEDIKHKILEEDYDRLSFSAYLPSIIATFMVYFVVNAVAVESARKGYRQIRNSREEEEKDETENEEKEDGEDGSEDRSQKSEDKENSEDN